MSGKKHLKIMLTGPNGGGKSTTAAMMPNPIIGVTEIQAIPSIEEANPDAKIFQITNPKELDEFMDIAADPDLPEYCDSLCLDSFTDVQRIFKDHFTEAQGDRGKATDFTHEDSWGQILDASVRLARLIRDAPVHVCLITLDKEADGVHRPAVYGKRLPNEIGQFFNLVGFVHYMERQSGNRFEVMFRAGDKYCTKKMNALDDVEPPLPEWWIQKRWPGAVSGERMAILSPLVEAWEDTNKAKR